MRRFYLPAIVLVACVLFSFGCEDTPSQPERCSPPIPGPNFLTGQYTWTRTSPTGDIVMFQYTLFRFSDDFAPVLKFFTKVDSTRTPTIHVFNDISATYTFEDDTLTIETPTIHPDGHSDNVPEGKFEYFCGTDSFLFIGKPDSVTTMRMSMKIP